MKSARIFIVIAVVACSTSASPPPKILNAPGSSHWATRVHLWDSNYLDEYLGYVELSFEAHRSDTGVVSLRKASATPFFSDNANADLGVGAEVVAFSMNQADAGHVCDVLFDVKIGRHADVWTSIVRDDNVDRGEAASEATQLFSIATTSTSAGFRRRFRITANADGFAVVEVPSYHLDLDRVRIASEHAGLFHAAWEITSHAD